MGLRLSTTNLTNVATVHIPPTHVSSRDLYSNTPDWQQNWWAQELHGSRASQRLSSLLASTLQTLQRGTAEAAVTMLPRQQAPELRHFESHCEALQLVAQLTVSLQPDSGDAASASERSPLCAPAVLELTMPSAAAVTATEALALRLATQAAAVAAREVARPLATLLSALAACLGALETALHGAPEDGFGPARQNMIKLVQHAAMQAALQVRPGSAAAEWHARLCLVRLCLVRFFVSAALQESRSLFLHPRNLQDPSAQDALTLRVLTTPFLRDHFPAAAKLAYLRQVQMSLLACLIASCSCASSARRNINPPFDRCVW